MPVAEIITIGTEILLGEIVDTNSRFLARSLRGLGIDLFRTLTIGDNVNRIAQALRESMLRADLILTTGGLGPTVDDPTREAVARAVGVETEFRPDLWEQIQAVIVRYGRTPTENQKRQAFVPRGAIPIPNPIGTAPAFIVEYQIPDSTGSLHSGAIISLPGVPQEMEYLFQQAVIPYLQQRFDLREIIKVRLIHTSGMSEAMIDERIADLETLANPTVGLAAHTGIIDIRITAKAENEARADQMIAEIESLVRSRLGDVVFGTDDETLEWVALEACANRGWNLVVVESGLEGQLRRSLAVISHPNLVGVETLDMAIDHLAEFTRRVRQQSGARAALGVVLQNDGSGPQIAMHLITPEGERSRQAGYGGPPRNASRWARNMALNWLRRIAQGLEE